MAFFCFVSFWQEATKQLFTLRILSDLEVKVNLNVMHWLAQLAVVLNKQEK